MKNKATAIIQARMGSERLPGKVLKIINSHTALDFLVKRLKKSSHVENIVIATSNNKKDNAIVDFCLDMNLDFYRGPEHDVLKRFQLAAKYYDANDIIRISGDCPFTDWEMLDKLVKLYFDSGADFVTNMYKQTFPLGFAIEVFKSEELFKLKNLNTNEKEHVTPYFLNNAQSFNFISVENKQNFSKYRMTLDTPEDYVVLCKVAESFDDIYFKFQDIKDLIIENPDYLRINHNIKQKVTSK